MSEQLEKHFHLRSFVGRNSRITSAQSDAVARLWPIYGLNHVTLSFTDIFKRKAPVIFEIGFGKGDSLLAMAALHPQYDFIGIETHEPGIGALLMGIEAQQLKNLRVMRGDAVTIFQKYLVDNSLLGIQIFFPDPWPKRRHIPRRLVTTEFICLAANKLTENGEIHLATDWEDYAKQMMQVLSQEKTLVNINGTTQFGSRSHHRPVLTKFERRAIREGRQIWDMQFQKHKA